MTFGQLQDLWRTAAAGHPGLAVVSGGAGVGKTRLVAEVAEMARLQGAVVASSQCFGTPGRLALAPVADWLRNPAVQAAAAGLDPAWRAEVSEATGHAFDEDGLPERYNLWLPRSACPHCGHVLRTWENLPVLSYLLLRRPR